MTLQEIAGLRLASQQVSERTHKTPKQLAGWMGAMQAQDFNMVRWAIGLRTTGSTLDFVDEAINKGEIIRTHLLRPTWHFVASDDLRWILQLSAPKIKSGLRSRQDHLGLPTGVLSNTNVLIAEALEGKQQLEREEIKSILLKSGIQPMENRISHILLWAELSGVICSGKIIRNKQTYALIDERVQPGNNFKKEELPALLAKRYFTSHGPATIRDFAWWSGMNMGEIRIALESAGNDLESFEVNSVKYWYGKNQNYADSKNTAWLLPAFDEFIISYADRSAILTEVNHKKAVSQNGIFNPVLIIGSQVAGLWKPVKYKDKIIVEVNLFKSLKKSEKNAVESAAEAYGRFLDKKTEVRYVMNSA